MIIGHQRGLLTVYRGTCRTCLGDVLSLVSPGLRKQAEDECDSPPSVRGTSKGLADPGILITNFLKSSPPHPGTSTN